MTTKKMTRITKIKQIIRSLRKSKSSKLRDYSAWLELMFFPPPPIGE